MDQIEQILQAKAMVSKGVLSIHIERKTIGDVAGPLGVTFTPAFEIDGTLTFQPLGHGRAFFNGDLALKPEETQPFIDSIIADGLIFQAFHQHYIEMSPHVWFIHWRGKGDALELARAVKNVLNTTSTPFPQMPPANPRRRWTPIAWRRSCTVARRSVTRVSSRSRSTAPTRSSSTTSAVSPQANIPTSVEFKPLSSSGSSAWSVLIFRWKAPR